MEKVLTSRIVFECPIFKVEEAQVEVPSGRHEMRWYVVKRDAVGIIPVDATGHVLLTKEYRSAAGEIRWRIPAGGVKEGEIPENAARRELREEIGYDCHELVPILQAKDPSALIKQTSHFYLARGLYSATADSQEWEHIEVVPSTPDDVLQLITRGEIQGNIARALQGAIGQLKNHGTTSR